jgi:tRNA(Arg) A34 adenosine deaminase TadA
MTAGPIVLTIPEWLRSEIERLPTCIKTLEERMSNIIRFSQLNFEQKTGGPFAAGVFEKDSGKVVAIGINRVVPMNCSSAHAEIMALSLAQQGLKMYDLGGEGQAAHQLIVNWRPCAMCFGAVLWSGVRSLVIAGSGPEMEELTGFDEGPMHPDWIEELNKRGIELQSDLLKSEACQVFRNFQASGSHVYNARLGAM